MATIDAQARRIMSPLEKALLNSQHNEIITIEYPGMLIEN